MDQFRQWRRPAIAVAALLSSAWPTSAQQIVVTPDNKSGIYTPDQKIGWTIRLADGQTAAAGRYTYFVKPNNFHVSATGSFELTSGTARIETTISDPGMLTVEIKPPLGAKNFGNPSTGGDGRVLIGAAVAPSRIHPVDKRPDDFDVFWSTKLEQLSQLPVSPVLIQDESGHADVEYATIRMNNLGGAHIYGQIARPRREGKFPALLILQWANPPYALQKQWVVDRAAEGWLALDIEPHDVPGDMPQTFYDALPQMIKSYQTIGNTDRDRSYFLPMYLGDYRAAEYLASRPDWDGRTLVVMGTGMGGQQSFVAAALSSKVTHLIVNEPAGADVNGGWHGRAVGYPNWDVTRQRVSDAARYFDTVNFASRITATCLVSMGFIDETAPPAGIWTAFNQIRGIREAAPMMDSPHENFATPAQQAPYTRRSEEWLDALVHGRVVPIH